MKQTVLTLKDWIEPGNFQKWSHFFQQIFSIEGSHIKKIYLLQEGSPPDRFTPGESGAQSSTLWGSPRCPQRVPLMSHGKTCRAMNMMK